MNIDKLLHSFDEAREIMGGVPASTFRLWITQGLICPVKIGRKPFFRHVDLVTLIEAHMKKAE
jgi:hypothetical protein